MGPADVSPHSSWFLAGLGFFGGLVDATGGGGWGPVTTSTMLVLGKQNPRRIVGTVNTAEFVVTVAASLGFVIGMWDEIVAHLALIAALLIGGVLAAPIAAWLISRFNPTVLGILVGTLLVALNAPRIFGATVLWQAQLPIIALGIALALRARLIRRAAHASGQPVARAQKPVTVTSEEPASAPAAGGHVPASEGATVAVG
ncbi:hypothetical protein HMPREF1219_01550 [Corynebacterium pyruviciproducens ATCC BAA-1742]|uniref:Probable membrane transporter protein n=1 Tax=Corynebacterium pyruviciproducens ATCC BAA-1742 TaxID=1125779 RepID=S2Z265_9CORY|nr:hypothetical protein HMPREF1219_01550 [Corynebacterium pyruviciproducens ATCC BAA-1742]